MLMSNVLSSVCLTADCNFYYESSSTSEWRPLGALQLDPRKDSGPRASLPPGVVEASASAVSRGWNLPDPARVVRRALSCRAVVRRRIMSADQGSAPARALRVQHAEAYRLHIIESVYPAHITGMTMALLITVVSKVRHPTAMRLVDDWSWSDFRGPFAVVAFVLLWCTQHTPRAYVEHFESACGLVNWLGMLARMSAMRGEVIAALLHCAELRGVRAAELLRQALVMPGR